MKSTYTAVATDDIDDIVPKHHAPAKSWTWILISLLLNATILLITILILFTSHGSSALTFDHCGNSSSEARSLGCKFDVLSFAWQVPQCYDEENTEAFLAHGNWTWFTDYHSTEQVSEAAVRTGDISAYVDGNYHVTHCTYMYRQLHRAYTLFGYVDSHVDNYNHTLHCQEYLLKAAAGMDMLEVNVLGQLRFPKCRKIS